ncbi:MAG: hypothetical protein C4581_10890 [Nitrospiraceae bacterium]|nr:MAG: hypothetical protein C4581_10890 [Nitrospiraceae bacterium]
MAEDFESIKGELELLKRDFKYLPLITLILLLIVSFSLIGCATTRIEKAAKALGYAGGSLYSPPHYMSEELRTKLSSMNLGEKLDKESKGLVYQCITVINKNYGDYIDVLSQGRAGLNVIYDSVNLGLTGAATAFSPVVTKTILAGLSTFFQGQKKSIDENIFDDKVIFALTSIMEVRRSEVLKIIMKKLDSTTYLLGDALVDLDSLYRAGSLQIALQAAYLNQLPTKDAPLPSTVTHDK